MNSDDAHGGLEVEDFGPVRRERVPAQEKLGSDEVGGLNGALDVGIIVDGLMRSGGRVVMDSERLAHVISS